MPATPRSSTTPSVAQGRDAAPTSPVRARGHGRRRATGCSGRISGVSQRTCAPASLPLLWTSGAKRPRRCGPCIARRGPVVAGTARKPAEARSQERSARTKWPPRRSSAAVRIGHCPFIAIALASTPCRGPPQFAHSSSDRPVGSLSHGAPGRELTLTSSPDRGRVGSLHWPKWPWRAFSST